MSQGATADIEVSLNDKRTEDYVAPPPPAYVAFSKGMALGSSSAGLLFSFCPPINLYTAFHCAILLLFKRL